MLSTRTDSAEGAADDAAGECSMVAAAFVARDRSSRLFASGGLAVLWVESGLCSKLFC